MKEDKYNVRVTFHHDNGITIDGKGCGQIYLAPNHDYFFENAPMQFINYLPQLRRLGVTYKITNDKRGCYQTYNLACYFNHNPYELLGQLRSNKAPIVPDDVEEEEIINNDEQTEEETSEGTTNIIDNDDSNDIDEGTNENTSNNITDVETPDDSNDETSTNVETSNEESTDIEEKVDIESMSKPELIDYAHKLGLSDVGEINTKKEIKELINNLK